MHGLMDCHLHTVYSGHGEGSVAQVVQAAKDLGFSHLCFTEHLPVPAGIDDGFTFSMSPQEVIAYRNEVLEAREANPQMTIVYGGEADWFGDNTDFLLQTTKGYEYLLGSCHMIDYWEYDHPDLIHTWEGKDVDAVWRRYFEVWCEAASSPVPFTCMAHPDLVKKFGHRCSFDPRELYAHAAQVAAANGRMVEVNTSGLFCPCAEQYPGPEFLKAFCHAGVDCTVGSDAHSPAKVGRRIRFALAAMYAAGYRCVTLPRPDGDRDYVALEELL
ncbi:MAG: histidinol-phosphatase HisJ family protein [Coriobacteriales bacterium]|nr:histidinol-phosphatase HisJ family protein [Coriobacteriales bacterium]